MTAGLALTFVSHTLAPFAFAFPLINAYKNPVAHYCCAFNVSRRLGGRAVAPVVLTLVQQFAARPEWTHRRGAIAALARLAEGSAQLFGKTYLAQSAQFLSGALADASPVVKYEAIQVK